MGEDQRKICPLCAWRANCVKRFSRGDSSTLHCPDFSEDMLLKKAQKGEADPKSTEVKEKP